MLVDVITDGRECGGKWECTYPLSSDFGTIEIRGGGPVSILDFAADTGFTVCKGDLQNHHKFSTNLVKCSLRPIKHNKWWWYSSVRNYILTAINIWVSDSQNALAWCYFHSPRKMHPLHSPPQACHYMLSSFVVAINEMLPHRTTDQYYCFILIFITHFLHSLEILP